MPQLDFSPFPSQAFWMLVSFVLMWAIMAKIVVPRITDILNQRQRKIDDYLAAASEFKHSAEEALEKYEKAARKANEKAAESLRKANEDLQKKIAEQEAKTAEKTAALLAENERKIEEKKKETMEKIEQISINLAAQIADKLGLEQVVSVKEVEKAAGQEQRHE